MLKDCTSYCRCNCQRVVLPHPPPPKNNGDRKDDYIMGCPGLIEPPFPKSRLSSSENGLLGNLVWLFVCRGTERNEAERNGTETFYGINRSVDLPVLQH